MKKDKENIWFEITLTNGVAISVLIILIWFFIFLPLGKLIEIMF